MPNSSLDVDAGAPNLESFTANGTTVTDNVTGLVWQQPMGSAATLTQTDALTYCASLSLGGFTDWRLPTDAELVSLVDTGQASPCINGTYFPNTPADPFWSSTPVAGSAGYAWDVDFGFGGTNYDVVSAAKAVRCVR